MQEHCKKNANSQEAKTRDETQKEHIMQYMSAWEGGFKGVDEACRKAMLDVVLLTNSPARPSVTYRPPTHRSATYRPVTYRSATYRSISAYSRPRDL